MLVFVKSSYYAFSLENALNICSSILLSVAPFYEYLLSCGSCSFACKFKVAVGCHGLMGLHLQGFLFGTTYFKTCGKKLICMLGNICGIIQDVDRAKIFKTR